ncbi:6-bladed beta-propeller [bacterium LRH843]|nr:6-bladed beta-propeller [bacterium LRH843]
MEIFSLGNKKYQVKKDWIQLPQNQSLNNITGISADNNGKIYVLQRSNPFMLVFSSTGELINEWSDESVSDGHYFRIAPDGRVCVADRNHHRIVVFNSFGEIVQIIGDQQKPGDLGAPFNHPTDVTVTNNGNFFVSDGYGNFSVHHFNSKGELINTWGKPGEGEGEFTVPHSVLVDKQNRILVCDRENNRVQIFDQSGKYLDEIKNIYRPMNICEDNEGFLYVTDHTPSLNLFNPDGELLGRFLTLGTVGHGVTVDENGDIYVAEMFHDKIIKFICLS